MTDQRERAMLVPITTHGCECGREVCATHQAIATALSDAERRGMERMLRVAQKHADDCDLHQLTRRKDTLDLLVSQLRAEAAKEEA